MIGTQSSAAPGLTMSGEIPYRRDIDGLRAVAILLVIGYHAFPEHLKAGFVGVDVFFVISGFLIGGIVLSELDRNTFSFVKFYCRRIRRIFPALGVVLICSAIFGSVALLPEEYKQLGKHIFSGAAFFSNFTLWQEAGYFDAVSDSKPLLHLWSLGVEEQFYIIWPVLLWSSSKLRTNRIYALVVITLLSFIANIVVIHKSPVAAFYSPVTRLWELACGTLLAYFQQPLLHVVAPRYPDRLFASKYYYVLLGLVRSSTTKSILGFGLLALAAVYIANQTVFPGWWACLPVLGAALIILAGPTGWLNRYILENRVIVFIGLISYPLYLWHWPILAFARIVNGETLSPLVRSASLAAAFFLACGTYLLLERPIRSIKIDIIQIALPLAVGLIGIALIGLLIFQNQGYPFRFGGALQTAGAMTKDWEYPPAEMTATVIEGIPVEAIGGSGTKTLFYGDSNIQQYAPRIGQVLGGRTGATTRGALFLTTGGGIPIDGVYRDDTGQKTDGSVFLQLANSPQVDRVVIGAAWGGYFTSQKSAYGVFTTAKYHLNNFTLEDPEGAQEAFLRLRRVVAQLTQKKKTVYLVLGIPSGNEFSKGGEALKNRPILLTGLNAQLGTMVSRHVVSDRLKFANDNLREIAKETGALIIDPIDHLCGENGCPTNGHKDQGHLRASYVRHYVDYLDATVKD
jgi:peptidoglycan/LPS O-acetylase OafA/YrhL